MWNGSPDISVIIPTTCELRRQSWLDRALRSAQSQDEVKCEVIVVVNGATFDPQMVQRLRANSSIKTLQIEEAHVSRARYCGVQESTSEFMCFLDDDDEFLPGALRSRVHTLRSQSYVDVLVTNGYFFDHCDEPLVDAEFARAIAQDPIQSFLATNWFASPASAFRRSSLEPSFFDLPYKYFEWTYLFFKLIAAGKRIEYCDAVTYRKFENHDLAVSRSRDYALAYPAVLLDLLKLPLDEREHAALKRRYLTALKSLLKQHLYSGELRLAWAVLLRRLRSGELAHEVRAQVREASLLDEDGRHSTPARDAGLRTMMGKDPTAKNSKSAI